MARIQMNYPGIGCAGMDIYLPQYGDFASHKEMTEEMFYNRKFPVLWLLHAEGENGSDWFRHSLLEEYAAQVNMAVVCPAIENSFGLNVKRGDPWESFLTGSLREAIFHMFPVSNRREDNYIAGVSMGGYAAVRLALKYPELFRAAGSLNGIVELTEDLLAYWWNKTQLEYVFDSIDKLQEADNRLETFISEEGVKPDIYLNCGLENRQYVYNKKLCDQLINKKYVCRLEEADGNGMDWDTRNMQLRAYISYLSLYSD